MINQNQEFSLKLQNSWKQGIVTIQGIVTCVFLRRFYPKIWWLQQRRFLRIYVKSMWKWNPLSPSTEIRKFGATDLLFGVRTEWPFFGHFVFPHPQSTPICFPFLQLVRCCNQQPESNSALSSVFLPKFYSSLSAKMFRRIQAPSLQGQGGRYSSFCCLGIQGKPEVQFKKMI